MSAEQLTLGPVAEADLEELFALHNDPAVWQHLPAARHREVAETAALVRAAVEGWERHGLDFWTARDPAGTLVGIGGVRLAVRDELPAYWNLYYRLSPAFHGRGLATEIARRGVEAAHGHSPEVPVIAKLLTHNLASAATARRAGLVLCHRGADRGHPEFEAQVYADRPVAFELVADAFAT